MEQILELINEEIDYLKKEIQTQTNKITPKEILLSKLKEYYTTPQSIISLQEEELTKATSISKNDLEYLKNQKLLYQYNIPSLIPQKSQQQKQQEILSKYITILSNQIKELKTNQKITKAPQKLNNLIHLQTILLTTNKITYETLKLSLEYLNQSTIPTTQKIEILNKLSNEVYTQIEQPKEYSSPLVPQEISQNQPLTREIEENENPIKENELVHLFTKYGYSYDTLTERNKQRLQTYGIKDNIESILKVLKENKVTFNIIGNAQTDILILSTKEIIETILNNLKKDNITPITQEKLNNLFQEISNHSSIFIQGKHQFKQKRTNNSIKTPNSQTKQERDIPGTYQNYTIIRTYLKNELGLNINDIIKNNASIFNYNPQTLKTRIEMLSSYNYPKENYKKALGGCLTAPTPLDTIDQFIETHPQGYEYVKDNPTALRHYPKDSIFYKILLANRRKEEVYRSANIQGLPAKQLFLIRKISAKNSEYGKIIVEPKPENRQRSNRGGEKHNGAAILEEYNYQQLLKEMDKSIHRMFEEEIKESDNYGITILSKENEYIKKLDNNYKIDEIRYNIDGIIISRYKVLRYYETLLKANFKVYENMIQYAIFKNSILTKEQVLKIMNALNNLFYHQKEKGGR